MKEFFAQPRVRGKCAETASIVQRQSAGALGSASLQRAGPASRQSETVYRGAHGISDDYAMN